MQRQRPATSRYGYSTNCALPRETDEKTSSDAKKDEATAAAKKDEEPKPNIRGDRDYAPLMQSLRGIATTSIPKKAEAAAAKVESEEEKESRCYSQSTVKLMKKMETMLTTDLKDEATAAKTESKKDKESESSSSSSSSDNEKDNDKNKKGKDKVLRLREKDVEFHPKKVPVVETSQSSQTYQMVRTAVPRTPRPLPPPKPLGRPLVLATHLVPSLPVGLFEVLVEAIEAATGRAVVILYEARTDRPVCTEVVDIAILPAADKWENGNLLPVSFVFDHHLNKTFSPAVYADVVVATDRAPHVETLMDLRGHRCALPDRKRNIGTTTLLFNYLRSKGEGPAFFGNTLDANSQVSALQMVAGKQVEVCILESPVIKFHRQSLPGVYSLHILSSLGPLPPYPIMVNKNLSSEIVGKIKDYLLEIRHDTVWLEKFAPYSVLGFAEYSKSLFDIPETKPAATSAPYY